MKDSMNISLFDRIFSSLSYITAGWCGLIVLFILHIRRKNASHFLRFNALQSILIALILFVVSLGLSLLEGFLRLIPFVNYLTAQISFIFNRPVFYNWSLIQVFLLGLTLYMAIFSLLGKYPKLYKISKIVDYNAR